LRFCNGAPSVVIRIGFIVRAVIGDALNHDFGIVAAREDALRVGPIVLGLAFVFAGHRPQAFLVVAYMPGCFGGIFMNREIAERG
jgi:hypothetical protein